ncbi:D-glycero-beta-D-manno-heptose-7-phosphate kinase [Roseomonas gilardii]|uniref:Bifunctional protein HldE n=1 Tax=Roseomonas gilardii TaxID=257708 RepID=A0A1L7AC91_9PROT|nr:D-glycero-beta-D-manno-heptose-7-phosphate kinase [Roseomonas gilardii]APT56418.1 bifunctional heptose 7-phosphate kinase/heptose 1-phosphate adenyltransferase [Roseomonas gilardii]MDT8332222.1 D-glycero-beta-D-manno-heptose-7-phosphate kinase [Roseomonas gilardii]PZR08991.1 MAG: D-glycero-beta-D-manno-heptose-7-phosphate kinase [Azospirillum brasilense]
MNGHLPESPVSHDLAEAVRSLKRASVLVVGDAMLDRFVYGRVARVSPEAPIPVLTVDREVAMPGGAGNVVRNLTALGTPTAFLSVVGDDQAGSDLTALIGGQSGVEPWLLVQGGRATTTKTRFVAQGQQLLRADHENPEPIQPRLAERMLRIAQDTIAATRVMVLSDYRKGVLAGDIPQRLIAASKAAGRKVVVDPKGLDYGVYAGADLVTPNRNELRLATGRSIESEGALVDAAQSLRLQHGFGAVLVTRAEDGMTLVQADGVQHFPAEAPEVYDVSGAGDTVVAVVAAAMAAGLPLEVGARLANIAAGIVVGKVGTAVAREDDILDALKPERGTLRKVVSRTAAAEQAERWRQRGYRVGFTNGCFDLLHPGHVHLLEQARSWCDRLVVGVNSDASVSRLKGPTRPIQGEAARAAVLASLATVDLVAVFEEDTPTELIRLIRPDVLVKGADYTVDQVVGGDLVQEWGGEVKLAELLPGNSTTATVARIKG